MSLICSECLQGKKNSHKFEYHVSFSILECPLENKKIDTMSVAGWGATASMKRCNKNGKRRSGSSASAELTVEGGSNH
jgi:hypothetical protein